MLLQINTKNLVAFRNSTCTHMHRHCISRCTEQFGSLCDKIPSCKRTKDQKIRRQISLRSQSQFVSNYLIQAGAYNDAYTIAIKNLWLFSSKFAMTGSVWKRSTRRGQRQSHTVKEHKGKFRISNCGFISKICRFKIQNVRLTEA
jgi:hypothetical protein